MRSQAQQRIARPGAWWLFGAGAFVVLAFVITGTPEASATVTVRVFTSDAYLGDATSAPSPATLEVYLQRGAAPEVVTTVNFDLIFDRNQFDPVGQCEDQSQCRKSDDCPSGGTCRLTPVLCRLEPHLPTHILEVVPPDFQDLPPQSAELRLRFAVLTTVFANPLPTLPDGKILSCTLPLDARATEGDQHVRAERLQVADNQVPAQPLDAQIVLEVGQIRRGARATETPTPTSTPATPTATFTATTAVPTDTPTAPSPTSTPVATFTPQERTPCPEPRPAPQGPALYVEDIVLPAGSPLPVLVTVHVRLATGGRTIVATQNDLLFRSGIQVASRNGRPDCTVNPAINKGGSAFAFLPTGCSGDACTGVRAVIIAFDNVDAIPDGAELYTCNATLSSVAASLEVTQVGGSDANGDPVPGVAGRGGEICVEPLLTPTPTQTATEGPASPTPTGTPTGLPSATSTATPSASPVAGTPTPTGTVVVGTPTPTRTAVVGTPTPSAVVTVAPGGDGDGCDCTVAGRSRGWSSVWLVLPLMYLCWRRRAAAQRTSGRTAQE